MVGNENHVTPSDCENHLTPLTSAEKSDAQPVENTNLALYSVAL